MPRHPDKIFAPPNGCRPGGKITMRFIIIVKASKDSEAGVMPQTTLAAMAQYHEENR
jgi:hypothetical protein